MKPLQFITIRRTIRGHADTASLLAAGRQQMPGTLGILGNLEHGASICPASESDRLALVAFLESAECKEASK